MMHRFRWGYGGRRVGPSWLLTGLALLGNLAGCGKPLNMEKAEQVIRDDLSARLASEGLHVSRVTCPKEVRMEQGESFACEASFEGGGSLRVRVEQTDSKGTINWKVNQQLLLASKVEEQIVAGERGKGLELAVNCGDRVRALMPKSSFACSATDGQSKPHYYEATVENEQGLVTYKPLDR
jgi:hypothetical protein